MVFADTTEVEIVKVALMAPAPTVTDEITRGAGTARAESDGDSVRAGRAVQRDRAGHGIAADNRGRVQRQPADCRWIDGERSGVR